MAGKPALFAFLFKRDINPAQIQNTGQVSTSRGDECGTWLRRAIALASLFLPNADVLLANKHLPFTQASELMRRFIEVVDFSEEFAF